MNIFLQTTMRGQYQEQTFLQGIIKGTSYHFEFEVELVKVKGSKRQKVSEVTLSAPEVYCWLAAGPPR